MRRLRSLGAGSLLLWASWAFAAPESSVRLADMLPPGIASCKARLSSSSADRSSIYVPAADGTKLAVDVFLPAGKPKGARFPAVFTATRYWRAQKGGDLNEQQKNWIRQGFAIVNMDVRGTGASFGQWFLPYAPQEAKDIGLVAGWIARQPWSDGHVVMTGNSYPGTTASIGAAYGAPAVAAVAPKFSDFDPYTDLLFPGGVVAEDLIVGWGRFVHWLDFNDVKSGGVASSVRPVDGADGETLLASAVAEHKANTVSFDQAAHRITFKDTRLPEFGSISIEDTTGYHVKAEIERSGVPIFGWGSWLDSGIAQGLLNRFMTFSNPQLILIGPWTHGAREDANVFREHPSVDPSEDERERMIRCYLQRRILDGANKTSREKSIIYFTMGEDRWKRTDHWPLPGTEMRRFYLGGDHSLAEQSGPADRDRYKVDFDASAGPANRWSTQAGGPRINYGDRAEADRRLLAYTGPALTADTEMTGQPVVTLRITSTHPDGNFIVYLEDVAPDGRVTYLTEGQLRALHRKLSDEKPPYNATYPYRTFAEKDAAPLVPGEPATLQFQLQPTSVLLRAGHRIRVAIAGADKGTFLRVPAADRGDVTIDVIRGGEEPSFVELPMVRRDRRQTF